MKYYCTIHSFGYNVIFKSVHTLHTWHTHTPTRKYTIPLLFGLGGASASSPWFFSCHCFSFRPYNRRVASVLSPASQALLFSISRNEVFLLSLFPPSHFPRSLHFLHSNWDTEGMYLGRYYPETMRSLPHSSAENYKITPAALHYFSPSGFFPTSIPLRTRRAVSLRFRTDWRWHSINRSMSNFRVPFFPFCFSFFCASYHSEFLCNARPETRGKEAK